MLAGEYDLRSEDEDEEGLAVELLEGLLVLFCAFETLSSADIRCVVVLMPLLEGRVVLEGRALLEGRSFEEGLDADAGLMLSEEGLLAFPPTCNPPWSLGFPEGLGAGARPPPGCGLCPPGPGL